jgi:hypothetical protein
MNKHILLVMKWLNNPETVSQEELEANFEAAYAAYSAAAYSAAAAEFTARAAASHASASHDDDAATDAAFWVDEYFKVTGEDKQTYIDALGE